MKQSKFSILKRIQSFTFALNGLKKLFIEEHNARVHLVVAMAVCLAGFLLKISASEWVAFTIVIGLVFILEIINTTLERIANFISPQINEDIKIIKDLAAAAVLIAAIVAIIIGTIILLPKILEKLPQL
jgi:diacylglycerol kinase (ATP)